MSESINVANLILGIIGTITGSIAIIIHYWRLRMENPRLETKVLKCEHDFAISESQTKTISFWTKFQIKNLGDRGTTIIDIGLTFEDNGEKHRLRKQHFIFDESPVGNKSWWINAHETIDIGADFWEAFNDNDKEQIDCTVTIYHTHGAGTVKVVSHKRES